MSLALGVARAVEKSLEGREVKEVERIRLEVGALAMVNVEQLSYCFEIASRGKSFEGAELEIEEKEARFRCPSCQKESSSSRLESACGCGAQLEFLSGDQLVVRSVKAHLQDQGTI